MLANRFIHLLPIRWSRNQIEERRRYFYQSILHSCSQGPDQAGILMGQDNYYAAADVSTAVISPAEGLLVFHVYATFHEIDCRHTYSLFQFGDVLKVGLLLGNGLEQAPLVDWHNEIGKLWSGEPFAQYDRDGTTLYEWTFRVPNLYRSWIDQESFVLGMRHCHQRVLRILNDYAMLKTEKNATK